MAELDKVFPGLASDLLATYGAIGKLIYVNKGEINSATGKREESTRAKTVKLQPPSPFSQTAIDGSLVQEGDAMTMVAARDIGAAPVANQDRVEVYGVTWQIVAVRPHYSGDLAAAYELHIRR